MSRFYFSFVTFCLMCLLGPLVVFAQAAPSAEEETATPPAAATAKPLNLGIGGDGLAGQAANKAGYDVQKTSATSVAVTIGRVVQFAMSFLGIIFTILILMAGFNWMTARGDEDKVKKSQATIQMAVIGLVIVMGAYAITEFVMQFFFNAAASTTPTP